MWRKRKGIDNTYGNISFREAGQCFVKLKHIALIPVLNIDTIAKLRCSGLNFGSIEADLSFREEWIQGRSSKSMQVVG